jgi:adenylate kinase family enzyme
MRANRIVVVGTTGSGKTTLAQQIAKAWQLEHVELDNLQWAPNWEAYPLDEFREKTDQALSGEKWVVDGNYSKVRDITWGRAQMIVWLDYPLWRVVIPRLFMRTVKRYVGREKLWDAENKERFWVHFYSKKDSLFWWAVSTYHQKRERYLSAMQDDAYAHLQFVHLQSPKATDAWVTEHLNI